MRSTKTRWVVLVSAMVLMVAGSSLLVPVTHASSRNPPMSTPYTYNQVSSEGSDFWLAFLQNYDNQTLTITLFISGRESTTGTVEIPGVNFNQSFSVTPGQITTIGVPADAVLEGTGVEDKGIHITASKKVTVYGLSTIQYSTDAFLALPTDSLGTEYLVLSYRNTPRFSSNGSQFGVVGTEDTTSVTFTLPKGGSPQKVTLNRGQVYEHQVAGDDGDVSGTVITSDKPVAVFGSHVTTDVPTGYTTADHLVEQMPPVETWGKEFVTMPIFTRQNGDTFRFLASEDATVVRVNGNQVATLNRGQFHEQLIDESAHIVADKPILVAQYSNGHDMDSSPMADPFMMLIPPFEQFLGAYTVSTPSSGFSINYINVVVPSSAVGAITLDGAPVSAGSFTPIGSSGFSGAQIKVNTGTHNLSGAMPFGAFIYGFNTDDSYGYPGGMSMSPVGMVATVAVSPQWSLWMTGLQDCVTANVNDQNNQPLAGIRVDFHATGSNTAQGFAATGTNGQTAPFCYTGSSGGSDTVNALVGTMSASATKTWVPWWILLLPLLLIAGFIVYRFRPGKVKAYQGGGGTDPGKTKTGTHPRGTDGGNTGGGVSK